VDSDRSMLYSRLLGVVIAAERPEVKGCLISDSGSVAKMGCWYCNSPALLPIMFKVSKRNKNDVRKQNCRARGWHGQQASDR
jgi:hypothetical protein